MKKSMIVCIIALPLIALAGCSGKAAYVSHDFFPGERPEWAAVLPFEISEEVDPESPAPEILRNRFFEAFCYLGYLDRDMAEIDEKLRSLGIMDPAVRDKNLSYEKLGELLRADYLLLGTVKKAVNSNGAIFSETFISAHIKMIEARTGKIVWEKEHQGSILSSIIAPESAVAMVQDKARHADSKKVFNLVAEKFARDITETIPDPATKLEKAVCLPRIKQIEVKMLKPTGDTGPSLLVAMKGNPALKAAFDIGNFRTGITMKETAPGLYMGRYAVRPGEWVVDSMIVCKLTNRDGISGKKVFRKGLITFGRATH